MLGWTFVETPICSCPLVSSGMMVVKHLITLFLYFIFYDIFLDFSCIRPNEVLYGICKCKTIEACRTGSRGAEGPTGYQRASLSSSSWRFDRDSGQNLEGLTARIPNYMGIEEVPIEFQIHIVGVILRVHQLLRRVARAVVCYRENNPPQ